MEAGAGGAMEGRRSEVGSPVGRDQDAVPVAAEVLSNGSLRPASIWSAAKPWMVHHTKARREKAMARFLSAAGS